MQTSKHGSTIDVAVGILMGAAGILLAQRPAGKTYEGYWEFPGGKLELGESVEAALTRELHEELGVSVQTCQRWKELEHHYAHAHVRLYFYKVTAWEGEPISREGQALVWQTLPVTVTPLLPAMIPVLAWLADDAKEIEEKLSKAKSQE